MKIILSLFDYSGNWSRPFREAGFNVIQIDKKLGQDILTWDYKQIPKGEVKAVLAAIPCTDYALSGARYYYEKDKDGRTAHSQLLVAKVKEILDYFKPELYAIENPRSRIHILNPWMGKPKLRFNPYEFAGYDPEPLNSAYQKETWLWGRFHKPAIKPLEKPGFLAGVVNEGNWMYENLGGNSERTKELRSITPLGFAYAFFEANSC